MSSRRLLISSPRCTCADASGATLLVGSAAVQAVLKFDQFYRSSVFKPSLDLLPCKCAYAKVIDLRNMVL